MSQAIQKFIELEQKKADVKRYFEELNTALEAVIAEVGVGAFFQDNDGIVYSTVVPEGRFVNYEKYSYVRTKRPGETRGTLSVKEAQEHGFTVNK